MPENVPPVEQAFRDFAAFAEGAILVGYDLSFTGKLLDCRTTEHGVVFAQERIDLHPIAKRLFYKKTNDYSLTGIERIFSGNKEHKTCAQYIGEAAYYANFLPYLQRDRHNYVPYFHIVVPRRKIRTEIYNAGRLIAENLMRCALLGKEHPLFPLWVHKCAEKLEHVSRFVDKKGERLPQDYYDSIFTGYNEAVWETKERLPYFKDEGEYTITDALCEKVFAIYDAVRVSCMPYLLNRGRVSCGKLRLHHRAGGGNGREKQGNQSRLRSSRPEIFELVKEGIQPVYCGIFMGQISCPIKTTVERR